MDRFDVAVVGAGFGGLVAALTAAESGARVVLFEQLRYPGGCASTFTRGGARFEAGATLFSGFAEGQLFDRLIHRHALDVRFESLDPVIELRAPDFTLAVSRERERFLDALTSLPGVPAAATRRFFAEQRAVADQLWALFDEPALLPPLSGVAIMRHLARLPRYAPLLRHVGASVDRMLVRHGLDDVDKLRTYLDAVCQITVQTDTRNVEAPFALSAMDYCFRGTGHVHGGIGELAWALARATERLGGELRMSRRVDGLKREPDGSWRVEARGGAVLAQQVVANLTPHALRRVLRVETGALPRLDTLARKVEGGWGAAMLYLVLEKDAQLRPEAHHLELVVDAARPFTEGNHLFVSISAADEERSESGGRTVTISTHVPMHALRAHDHPDRYIAEIQARMRTGLAQRAPEVSRAIEREMSASPRTFARFTGRDHGYVGGIPRRVGLGQYAELWPRPLLPGLFMVGDSVLSGQSTLATALGGVRVVEAMGLRKDSTRTPPQSDESAAPEAREVLKPTRRAPL